MDPKAEEVLKHMLASRGVKVMPGETVAQVASNYLQPLFAAAAKDHPGNNSDDEYAQVAAAGLNTAAAAVSNPDFWKNFTNKGGCQPS